MTQNYYAYQFIKRGNYYKIEYMDFSKDDGWQPFIETNFETLEEARASFTKIRTNNKLLDHKEMFRKIRQSKSPENQEAYKRLFRHIVKMMNKEELQELEKELEKELEQEKKEKELFEATVNDPAYNQILCDELNVKKVTLVDNT